MKKFPGFSFEVHKEAAKELNDIQRRLNALLLSVSKAYGVSSKQARAVRKIAGCGDGLAGIKSALDNAYFHEDEGLGVDSPYFGTCREHEEQ